MVKPGYLYREIRDNLDIYTGLGAGIGAYVYNVVDGTGLKPFLNTFNGEKLFHGVFSYGIAGSSLRAIDIAGDYLGELFEEYEGRFGEFLETSSDFLDNFQDFRYRTALVYGAIGVFSAAKEMNDSYADGFDAAANYIGASAYLLKDYYMSGNDQGF